HVGMNIGGGHLAAQRCGHEKIIDAPADVARAGVGEIAPPRVVPVALLEQAEGIDEAGFDEILETLALLVREALLAPIGLRIRQIVLGVRDVQIAAENDGLLALELAAIGEESRVPVLVAQLQSAEIILGVRGVDRDYVKLIEFGRDQPPLSGAVALEL